jgi:adenylate cyclase class 1
MIQNILARNKRQFVAYNDYRKQIFLEMAPKEAEIILYLLPWLLCINEPGCPGYIANLKRPFRIQHIDFIKEIRKRESDYKKMFNITKSGTLLKPPPNYILIDGLYTIGSVGSVGQTATSDCDIWVCLEKNSYDKLAWLQIHEKVNLIKDWLDANIKMPVFFFISDIAAIRESRFGSVDSESSGSTQQDVLKEEFYRSCMVICGKTPLWWLCYNPNYPMDYQKVSASITDDDFWEYDLVDFGDIETIEKELYFGAALWQFHKSLSRPLKSIIKIILLRTLLEAPQEKMLCHRFRESVLTNPPGELFPDFSVFTMSSILDHFDETDKALVSFLSECYYLLCEINPYDQKQKIKNQIATALFKKYLINRRRQTELRKIKNWHFRDQIDFGNRIFKLLLQIYKEISAYTPGVNSESDRRDLTILGRKISAHYVKKKYKIPVIQTATGELNISNLTFHLNGDVWQVFSGNDNDTPMVWSKNIIYNLAYIVWNDLFIPNGIHMRPNPSDITLQEIVNLASKIRYQFGTYSTLDIDFDSYLKKEYIIKMLVITDFRPSPWYVNQKDSCVVYINCWGELFVRLFSTAKEFETFLKALDKGQQKIEFSHYVRRNLNAFEKNIERTKRLNPVKF